MLISLLTGCSSTPVALTPVGPNPISFESPGADGQLEVFSYRHEQSDDQNQGSTDSIWYQPTDYDIYKSDGRLVKHIENNNGHYGRAPRVVNLPSGQYFVRAYAVGRLPVRVPVMIERGEITRIHLDDNWKPLVGIVKTELVELPNGKPIGWQTNAVQ